MYAKGGSAFVTVARNRIRRLRHRRLHRRPGHRLPVHDRALHPLRGLRHRRARQRRSPTSRAPGSASTAATTSSIARNRMWNVGTRSHWIEVGYGLALLRRPARRRRPRALPAQPRRRRLGHDPRRRRHQLRPHPEPPRVDARQRRRQPARPGRPAVQHRRRRTTASRRQGSGLGDVRADDDLTIAGNLIAGPRAAHRRRRLRGLPGPRRHQRPVGRSRAFTSRRRPATCACATASPSPRRRSRRSAGTTWAAHARSWVGGAGGGGLPCRQVCVPTVTACWVGRGAVLWCCPLLAAVVPRGARLLTVARRRGRPSSYGLRRGQMCTSRVPSRSPWSTVRESGSVRAFDQVRTGRVGASRGVRTICPAWATYRTNPPRNRWSFDPAG